ncbi:MAG TPA: PaaX family transcriptional regulator C-terminal domain-containing protein [Polyangiaceae bacterium]|nr:PaaX family transcriptional regulator C-terminal domain-containing protein [Polyangiaceae bacterium]
MEPNPRQLILRLLVSSEGGAVSARACVAAGEIFGIRENSVRVALVRLAAAGKVEATGRGEYRIGPNAADLAEDIREWRNVESRVRPEWSGRWIGAATSQLARSDRNLVRRRERGFELLGFRELEPNLFVRPDNLVGGPEAARERLRKLGLGEDACAVFSAGDFDEERDARARTLWNGKKLTKSYVELRKALEAWLERAPSLHPMSAARESFVLGHDAIRTLVFDPLLPAPLVDVKERRAFVETLIRYDKAGHKLWRRVLTALSSQDADRPRPTVNH